VSSLESAVEFAENPDPRCPCVLILDTSGSMAGAPIKALNDGLRAFQDDVRQDELASRRVEVAIVTFGNGGVQTVQDLVTAGQFVAPTLKASGATPMGAAIDAGLELLRRRKDEYRANGVAYYRPWMVLITDGEPTDSWSVAADRARREEDQKGLSLFAIGVDNANMSMLAQIAPPTRPPIKLSGHKFSEMFVWLSQSQRRVSASKPGDQTALPPVGWGAVSA
jgi:uncharacterized protein YegL